MKLIGILFFTLVFVACSAEHSKNDKKQNVDERIQQKLSSGGDISFDFVFQTVLQDNCLECHSSSRSDSNVNLSTYDFTLGASDFKSTVFKFEPDKSSLYQTTQLTSGKRAMPPSDRSPLSQAQKDLIFKWIEQGAKGVTTPGDKSGPSKGELFKTYFENPETIDYQVVNKQVFVKNCLDCHSNDGLKPDFEGAIQYGQDMSDYKALFTDNGIVPNKLVDYVVNQDGRLRKKTGSRIYKSIAISQTMPPTEYGYKLLDGDSMKLLRLWIKNCAIEDYNSIKDNDTLLEEDDSDRFNGKVRDCS